MSESRFRYLEIGGPVRRRREVIAQPTALPVERVTFRLAETIGAFGEELGQFNSPGGLTLDLSGNLYVADSRNNRVQKITPDGDVYGLGGPGLLLHPQGVAVDTAGFIYIVEQGASRLQKFGPTGHFMFAVGGPQSGTRRFSSPTAIALDGYHQIYVADTDNNRVTCYTATGRWHMDFHGPTPDLPLARPQGVAVDVQGRIYVSDTLRHRVIRMTPEGKPDAVIGRAGPEPGAFSEPRGLAVDLDGGLWVADAGNDRVQKFSPEGHLVCCFPHRPDLGIDLASPNAVAVDSQGNVYITDSLNHRVLRLAPDGALT